MSNRWAAPITDEAIEKKIAEDLFALSQKYGVLYNLAIYTGISVEQIIDITVGELDRDCIHHTTDDYRDIPISMDLYNQLHALSLGHKPDDYVFTAHDNVSMLSSSTFKKALQRSAANQGLNDIIIISLRKTYYYHMYKKYGIEHVSKQLGHLSTNITKRYLGVGAAVAEESRRELLTDKKAETELDFFIKCLDDIKHRIYDPINPDSFYTTLADDISIIRDILLKYVNPS